MGKIVNPYQFLSRRYLKIVEGIGMHSIAKPLCSLEHVKWMLSEIPKFQDREKQARWIGFVQGVLDCLGIIKNFAG